MSNTSLNNISWSDSLLDDPTDVDTDLEESWADQLLTPTTEPQQRERQVEGSPMSVVGQGTFLGFGDEATAGAVAGGVKARDAFLSMIGQASESTGESFHDIYEDVLAAERAQIKAYQEENPGASFGLEILGAVPTLGIGASRPLASALAGGTAYGAGTGEDLMSRGLGAAQGAVTSLGGYGLLRGAVGMGNWASSTRAGKLIKQAIERTGKSIHELMDELRQLGPEGRLVDLLPEFASNKIRTYEGGHAVLKEFLEGRAQKQQTRLIDSLNNLSADTSTYFDNLVGLDALRKREAAPLYKEAYDQGIQYTESLWKQMESLKAKFPAAWNYARKLSEGTDNPLPKDAPSQMTLEQFDWFKQAVDDAIDTAFRGGKSKLGAQGREILRDVLGEIDGQNKPYAAARKAYADPSRQQRALELGRKVLNNVDPEDIAAQVGRMSDVEKEKFLIGAVRAVRDKILAGNDMQNMANRFNNLMKMRLRNAFPDQETFDQFVSILGNEDTFARVKNQVMGGSPTAMRLKGQAEVGMETAVDFATNPKGALTSRVIGWLSKLNEVSDKTAKEAAQILVTEHRGAKALEKALRGKVRKNVMRRILQHASFGAAVGTNVNQPTSPLYMPLDPNSLEALYQ